jgi:hypothetical protein
LNKSEFIDHLLTAGLNEPGIEGVVVDDTQPAVRESAFAPVAEEEVEKMGSLMAQMAAAARIDEAVNPEAIAESKAKKLTRLPLKKISADKQFYRLRNDKAYYAMNVRVLELKTLGSTTLYMIAPNLQLPAAIRKDVKLANIYTGMTATKEAFLLYVTRNSSSWYESAIEMMRLALNQWIKVVTNGAANGYDYFPAPHAIADPDWSGLPSFNEMLALGFRGRVIESADHPAIRRSLGLEDAGNYGDDGAL